MRLIIFLLGVLAGLYIKDSNVDKWLEIIKNYFKGRESQKPQETEIPLLPKKEEKKVEVENTEEVFPDPLEKIKGIGPVIKSKLNEQGIFTFVQLGALTPTELEEIVGASIKRFADEEEIIRQAQELAK